MAVGGWSLRSLFRRALLDGRRDLAADFAAGPYIRVDVHISGSGPNGPQNLFVFTRCNSLCSGSADHIRRGKCAPDRRGRSGTRLRAGRAVAKIGAQEHNDAAVHAALSEVNMRLCNVALKVPVSKLPV